MEKITKNFLLKLLGEVRLAEAKGVKIPPSVRRARRIVEKFQRSQWRIVRKRRDRFERLKAKAERAIHFGTEKQARAAVAKVEAFK